MKLFFTSDTHFGHGNIMKYSHRPGLTESELELLAEEEATGERLLKVSYDSVKRMDDYLLDGINSIVGEDDILYHLGDFCMGVKDNALNAARRYRNAIKCQNVHLVWGNHDNYSIRPLFSSAMDMNTVRHNGQEIVCLHYAMAIWNKSHRGAWHLYGHSHANAEEMLNKLMPGRKAFDVGVDNAAKILGSYRPFSFDEVKKIMESRKGCAIDHHEGDIKEH